MRILIVEDNHTQRVLLRAILARAEHDVLEARDGHEAWGIIQNETIQLVITDWMMPDLDGPTLIRLIREANLPQYIYVLLLTARDGRIDVVTGLHGGADDYLTKPVDPEELLARVAVGERVLALETNLRTARDQLRIQAAHDGLTGLLNRRALYDQVNAELARTRRKLHPIGVLLMDVDFFKRINDQYGHAVGDQALQQVARIINEQKREYDLAARWGGEEFAMVLPDTDLEGAAIVAERLRVRIAETSFAVPRNEEISLYMSIGVAGSMPGERPVLDALLQQADAALYHAKRTGRNRVCLSSDLETDPFLAPAPLYDQDDPSTDPLVQDEGASEVTHLREKLAHLQTLHERLHEQMQRFHDGMEAASVYLWEVDAEGRYTFLSEQTMLVLGYAPAELLGLTWFEQIPSSEAGRVASWFQDIAAYKRAFRGLEHRIRCKTGDPIWQQVNGKPVLHASGQLLGYRGMAYDITRHKKPRTQADRSSQAAAPAPAAPRQQPPDPSRPHLRVLVAEDSLVNQKIVSRMVEIIGHHVDAVANGQEVVAALQGQIYDVVLMDVQMPEMDGLEATRQIRRLDNLQQPCIIALSASSSPEDQQRYRSAGMDDCLTKPVHIESLAAILQRNMTHEPQASRE